MAKFLIPFIFFVSIVAVWVMLLIVTFAYVAMKVVNIE